MLSTVLRIRKKECETTIKVSFDRTAGNAIRNNIALSWRINAASILGLAEAEIGGKCLVSAANFSDGVGYTGTCSK
jgi:hypothetical protein